METRLYVKEIDDCIKCPEHGTIRMSGELQMYCWKINMNIDEEDLDATYFPKFCPLESINKGGK